MFGSMNVRFCSFPMRAGIAGTISWRLPGNQRTGPPDIIAVIAICAICRKLL